MNQSIPILIYHQIASHPSAAFRKYTVTPEAFAQQMKWLAWRRYAPIDLDALVDYRAGRRALPRRPIVITFDDGYQACADNAAPILKAHGFTAVIFLVAGLAGELSHWLLAERGVEYPIMGWDTARRLSAEGFHIGSHTVSHPRLSELPEARCRAELLTARQLISDQLGRNVRHLAYPFGLFNTRVRALAVEAGYQTACSVTIGFSTSADDLLALQRVPVLGSDSLFDFTWRLQTARALGEWLDRKAHGAYRLARGTRAQSA